MESNHKRVRGGFTLLELLAAIAIIGLLAAMTVKGIAVARRYAASSAMSVSASNLGQALEEYRQKFGDYPPDFSNASVVNQHFRKAFRNIQNSELALIANAMARYSPSGDLAQGIDEAESLVFCLGGFSDDPKRPFTGPGGPLVVKATPSVDTNSNNVVDGIELTYIDNYQYNTDRNPGFYNFGTDLTIIPDYVPVLSYDDLNDAALISASNVTPVWDPGVGNNTSGNFGAPTTAYASAITADPFPVYRPKGREMPYVYFDSRTYAFVTSGSYYFNNYLPRPVTSADYRGVARPLKSREINTAAVSGTVPATLAALDAIRFYAKKDSFQVIGAGVDDHFGGIVPLIPEPSGYPISPASAAVNYVVETGEAFICNTIPLGSWPPSGVVSTLGIDPNSREFQDPSDKLNARAQQDNVTSIVSGELVNNIQQP